MNIIFFRYASLLILIAGLTFTSCKKDDPEPEEDNTPYTCTTCSNTAQGNAAYDNSSAGLYKGVLAGSSGVFKVFLENGLADIFIVATFDGVSDTLRTDDLDTWNPGDAISGAVFTGDQGITITFSVNADGTSPTASATITGHSSVTVLIGKETSTNLIQCFEGTFSGVSTGVFNYFIVNNSLTGVAKSTTGSPDPLTGTVVSNAIAGTGGSGGSFSGTISGDNASGTFVNASGTGTGNWTGKRTL